MSVISPSEQEIPKTNMRPPRDGLIRMAFSGVELRDTGNEAPEPVMAGHFAVFNEWTEINSMFEGRFMERIAPGAFKKTFRENRDAIRVLFQHGSDPQIGDKPIGSIDLLREDEQGASYEVSLLDADYVRDSLLPGLRAGLYGASFRFRVLREEVEEDPKPSEQNPLGLPERTIREAQVMEFGPVTFPAYASATAGIRSLTDEFLYERLTRDPERLRCFTEFVSRNDIDELPGCDPERAEMAEVADDSVEEQEVPQENSAPPVSSAETESHPARGRRDNTKTVAMFRTRKPPKPPWLLGQKGRKDDHRGTRGTRGRA